ncbi:hypothetical protein DWB61_14015 [Ancylomarina euxinus]|uniref:Lipoprotein n=1 Tax=Ancylomarina euxinus TaxID=2283627 RepID=A0A425XYN3_9BACT|nr:hypothetical protein [Ancylomarina euxinus]MCZ4695799.1 hypothetical protein [Ancylomarina euxinus]MUP16138.1 hypothetical protein [Ancylomarina euxinus]RRG19858.1 hypothetical protein DWB61_14015 [Ancylomarina euxinus]
MKIITSVLILFLGFSSCDASKNVTSKCEVQNPLEDVAWLKELKESLKDSDVGKTIYQASYKNETVFYVMITDPRVRLAFGVTLWDCEGKVIREFKSGESEDYEKLVTNRIVLYQHVPSEKE